MSISNYSELQAEITNWLKRAELVNDVPTFITLAEAEFNRIIRTTDMEVRSQATADDEFLGFPDDWMEVREVHLVSDLNRKLKYLSPQAFTDIQTEGSTGKPFAYTVIDEQLRLYPAPDATSTFLIEITYIARIPALNDTDTTNWLLTKNPDIYLYGALVHAEGFLYNDKRMPVWKSMYGGAINQLNTASGKTRVGDTPMMPRVSNVV